MPAIELMGMRSRNCWRAEPESTCSRPSLLLRLEVRWFSDTFNTSAIRLDCILSSYLVLNSLNFTDFIEFYSLAFPLPLTLTTCAPRRQFRPLTRLLSLKFYVPISRWSVTPIMPRGIAIATQPMESFRGQNITFGRIIQPSNLWLSGVHFYYHYFIKYSFKFR